MRRGAEAEITVFLALSLAVILALLLSLLESARTQAARLYFTSAANASIDSLFSQYHKELWGSYRLLGLEHYSGRQIQDEAGSFLVPYLEADNWFPMEKGDIEILEMQLLTEENGRVFEEEVLDYMRYGIAAEVWDLVTAQEYMKGVREGAGSAEISGLYRDHATEAARLENDLRAISGLLVKQEELFRHAEECLEDPDGEDFIRTARKIVRVLKELPEMTAAYGSHANSLEAGLAASEQKMEEAAESGALSPEAAARMREEIREYESYVAGDGERRREILAYPGRAEANVLLLEDLIADAEEVQDRIDEWEPDDDEDAESSGDGPDEEALWDPLRQRLRRYDLITMDHSCGMRDTEAEQKLEDLGTILKTNILKLVLPKEVRVNNSRLADDDAPSSSWYKGEDTCSRDLTDRIFIAEYMVRMTDHLERPADGREGGMDDGFLETEYILAGKDNDADNLTETVERLAAVRTGLNLAYLYTDSAKRAQARALAMEITGALGLTPLTAVMMFFIMSIWALAQAVCDVRDLLAGKRVPFMHDAESFTVTPEGLMAMADGRWTEPGAAEGRGMTYTDYLRIFFLAGLDSEMEFRCMDVIQADLGKQQDDFRLDRMIRSLELRMEVHAAHVFTAVDLTGGSGFLPPRTYDMHVTTAFSY